MKLITRLKLRLLYVKKIDLTPVPARTIMPLDSRPLYAPINHCCP